MEWKLRRMYWISSFNIGQKKKKKKTHSYGTRQSSGKLQEKNNKKN